MALLVDNRTNQETDFGEASAVTILGTAEEILDLEREKFLKIFLKKHPYLEEFVTSPTCALIRVKVEKFIMVTQFQEVREIYPSHELMSLTSLIFVPNPAAWWVARGFPWPS